MKNKEAYKQAFKHVHYQKEINLNQRRIPKPFITLATSLIVLLSTFTVAYAFDVGGIQSKLEVWFHGEKRNVQYEKVGDDTYHLYTTDENGNVIDIGIDSGTKWTPTGMKPMTGDELVESLNDEFGIFYDEKEEKNCYLVINNGQKDIYFVMSYKTKIDEDNAISLYDDENREVYHGVKVKDIKDKFVRIK